MPGCTSRHQPLCRAAAETGCCALGLVRLLCGISAGRIVSSQINSYRNGRSRGNGTVLFKTEKEAEKAIQQKNDTELQGREIFVKEDKYPE